MDGLLLPSEMSRGEMRVSCPLAARCKKKFKACWQLCPACPQSMTAGCKLL